VDALRLGSNVVAIRVYGRPRLNGPASGIEIEPGAGDALRINATVVNEGDAPARDVRVVIPPPPGFEAAAAAGVAASAELAVGEMLSIAYDATPIGAVAAGVCIDDAFISYDGGRVALRTVRPSRLLPKLAPPAIACRRRAGRLDLLVRVENTGWVPAREVGLALALPAGWRIVRGTIHTGSAPAALRRNAAPENGVAITLPLVPARGTVEVTLVATASRERVDGELTVECGGDVVVCAIPPVAERSLHLEASPEFAFGEPAAIIPVLIDAYNTGETSERVTLLLAGEPCWSGELRAGAAAGCIAPFRVPDNRTDGDVLTVDAEARAEDGGLLATTQLELRVLDRPRISVDDAGCELAEDPARPVVVAVQCTAPGSARSGERLDVRIACTPADHVETLRIRPRPHAGAFYVAGSTTVNGHAVVDGADGPPLWSAQGLALHDIPGWTLVEVAWSIIGRTPGDHDIALDIEANGFAVAVPAVRIAIAEAPPFGARPIALPFHIDAPTVGDVAAAPEAWALAAPDPPSVTTSMVLDAPRCAAILRVLRGARGPGLVSHLPALTVLFPTAIASADSLLAERFDAVALAIRGVYERLFVKLRIPGYGASAGDLEDALTRAPLLALFERIGQTGETPAGAVRGDIETRVDAVHARAALAALTATPIGGRHTLAAIAVLLPRRGTHDAAVALGTYVDALTDAFDAACALAPAEFSARLTAHSMPGLDAARALAVAALAAQNEPLPA
jgi:hypothetical protein